MEDLELVSLDHHIVVQRDSFTKIHKLTEKNMDVRLGQDTINLSLIVGKPYWTAYKMIRKGNKRFYNLTTCVEFGTVTDKILTSCNSGNDNRDIQDDGLSQRLSTGEIVELRNSGVSAETIVTTLVENSKTFGSKTEYSQEKYLKKKEKKYLEIIVIKKPSFRLIAESVLRNSKSLGLRMDTLSQLTTLACVRAGGTYMVYETGCQGLVTAAIINAIGPDGTIIHVHNGNSPEKQAVNFMDLSKQRTDQIRCVSIFHVLKKVKCGNDRSSLVTDISDLPTITKTDNGQDALMTGEPAAKKARWEEREESAIEFLREKLVDGLVVVGKEEPGNIVLSLLKYLQPARPFVAFSMTREPLSQLFLNLKAESEVTALRLTESWLRTYQVLPDRTHPDINMSGSGGCLLSGFKVSSS